MDQQTRFHDALQKLDLSMQRAAERIEAAPPSERPTMEAKLNTVLAQASSMNPHSPRAAELAQPASEDGIYSTRNTAGIELDEGDAARLVRALAGTGINPDEVAARMQVGASNAALERQWIADDVRAIADERGLDLKDQRQFEAALAEVDRIHDRIGGEFGIGTETPVADERAAPDAAEQAAEDHAREAAQAREAASWVHNRGAHASKADLTRLAAPVGEADAQRFRAAVEDRLTPDEIARLRRGDISVLEGAGNREEQLTIAREYLKAESHSPEALRQVTRELHQEREIAHSQRGHDDGIDHA